MAMDYLVPRYSTLRPAYRGTPIPRGIPVFLMRATRDEAALALGVGQALQAISSALFDVFERPLSRLGDWLKYSAVLVPAGAIAYVILLIVVALFDRPFPDIWSSTVSAMVLASGVAFLPIAIGRLTMAIAAGDWCVVEWPRTLVKVDAAPPDTPCRFKSYGDLYAAPDISLRHGIYGVETLQVEVRRIIKAVRRSKGPRLLHTEELEDELRRRDRYMRRQNAQPSNFRWVETTPRRSDVRAVDSSGR
jgi:hypothetical protein